VFGLAQLHDPERATTLGVCGEDPAIAAIDEMRAAALGVFSELALPIRDRLRDDRRNEVSPHH